MISWSDTLLDYLRLSNEDERIVDFVNTVAFSSLADLGENIDWLEVGPGPGTKTVQILQSFATWQSGRLNSLRLMEPSLQWRRYLSKHQTILLRGNRGISAILDTSKFERFAQSEMVKQDESTTNFITFFHVLYDQALIEEVVRYLKHRMNYRKTVVACIVVESEASDLFQLRHRLASSGYGVPFAAAPEIRRVLAEAGLPTEATEVNGQYCTILQDGAYSEWLLAFLLGCTRGAIRRMSKVSRIDADHLVQEYIDSKQRRRLQVPDVAITIRIG